MNNQEFKKLVGNKIFTATNIKADKTQRTFNARVDVSKHTVGGTNTVEHKPNLVTVFEMDKGQYRTLNLDTLVSLKAGGKVYKFGEE